MRFRTRLDDLDDLYFPSRGSFQEFRLDLQHPDLADDASFRRYSAEAGYYRSVSSRATVGLGGYWGLLDGSAPFYENIFIGGRRYLGIASLPFYGLERDERQARHYAQMHLSYRHRVKSFTLGFVRSIYLQGGYELGFFNQTDALRRFQPALHGFGGGLHLRTRVVGPIQFDLGGTNQGHFGASISVGRAF